jgi:predicted Zn-dependent protease
MRPALRSTALFLASAAMAVACAKVPFTNRKQYNLIPDVLMRGVGKSTYSVMLGEQTVKKQGADNTLLQQVGKKISKVADQPKYNWEFSLINSDELNAWCLPGGYIGFYTGILPVLKNEAGMAFVMGHEVGHATAHHGAERLSQQLTLVGGLVGLELFMKDQTKLKPEERGIVLGALGVGATVGALLPFSRMHESEADTIGMMYMSSAGYPPAESLKVWTRMEKETGGSVIPPFLSTHPTNKKRKANLRDWMGQADKRYARNALKKDTLKTLWGAGAGTSTPADGGDDKSVTKPN